VAAGFLKARNRELLLVAADAGDAIEMLIHGTNPAVSP